MDKLQQRVEESLAVLDPTNTEATLAEKEKAFLVIKEALSIIYE